MGRSVRIRFWAKNRTPLEYIQNSVIYLYICGCLILAKSNNEIKVSYGLLFRNFCTTSFFCFTLCYSFGDVMQPANNYIYPWAVVTFILFYSFLTPVLLLIITTQQIIHRDNITEISHKFKYLDTITSDLNYTMVYSGWPFHLVLALISTSALTVICLIAIIHYWMNPYMVMVIFFMFGLHMIQAICFTIGKTLHSVFVQFNYLNMYLRWFHKFNTRKSAALERACKAHHELSEICKRLESVFGPLFLVLCILFTCQMLFAPYDIIRLFLEYRIEYRVGQSARFIRPLAWETFAVANAFMLMTFCEKIRIEANEFNNLLYEIMLEDKTDEFSTNKKLRLHISMKKDVTFSAYGFFKVDYNLLHSMVAAATTYLVILLQFGDKISF